MFGRFWEEPKLRMAQAGDYGPGGYEGWQPWARSEEEASWGGPGRGHRPSPRDRGPRGPRGPRGRWGGPGGPWGGPWGGPGGGPWGGPGGEPWAGPGAWLWQFARRFPFGPGMDPGPGRMRHRMFGRGDLKYALLDLLRERPKHGYEMIKDLEERSGGFYTPSAGAVYPTLQLLEDRGWVSVETVEGKKVYALTDAGRAALTEHEQQREEFRGRHFRGGPGGPGFGPGRGPFGWNMSPELGALGRESFEVADLMRRAVMSAADDPEQLTRLRAIVERAKGDLREFLAQGGPRPQPGPAGPQSGPVEQI